MTEVMKILMSLGSLFFFWLALLYALSEEKKRIEKAKIYFLMSFWFMLSALYWRLGEIVDLLA